MDCLEGMRLLPDDSVDMILCDLPYGVLDTKNKHTAWDSVIPFDELWKEYERIAKPSAAIVLTAVQPFTTDLINSNRKLFRYELVWAKTRASGFLNAKKKPISAHENILVFYKSPPIYSPQKYQLNKTMQKRKAAKRKHNKQQSQSKTFNVKTRSDYEYVDDGSRYPDSVLEFGSAYRKGMHPTEKPVDLFAWLIRSFTKENDVVLDNCLGSGTTALAAILEKRQFIAFEQNKEYFEMSVRRIVELKSQI